MLEICGGNLIIQGNIKNKAKFTLLRILNPLKIFSISFCSSVFNLVQIGGLCSAQQSCGLAMILPQKSSLQCLINVVARYYMEAGANSQTVNSKVKVTCCPQCPGEKDVLRCRYASPNDYLVLNPTWKQNIARIANAVQCHS